MLVSRRGRVGKFRNKDDFLHCPGLSIRIQGIHVVTIMKMDVSVCIVERLHLRLLGPAWGAESSRVAGAIGETTFQPKQKTAKEGAQGSRGTSRR